MTEGYLVRFPDGEWINAGLLEQALQRARRTARARLSKDTTMTFVFPSSCKVMVDAAVRLLSLANQLTGESIPVIFVFEGEQHEAMSYLHRAFFFSLLAEEVEVLPKRPDPAHVEHYQGRSSKLIEFKALNPRSYEAAANVPSQLADALETALATYSSGQTFRHTSFTLFSELMNNVYDHSCTELNGFAALQVYRERVQVVVSDSGVGLLTTLRPKLFSPEARDLEEPALLYQFFTKKLRWHDYDRGQGLQECAKRSLQHRGSIDIRLQTSRIVLRPSPVEYRQDQVRYARDLFPLKGTHICFSFPLDKLD